MRHPYGGCQKAGRGPRNARSRAVVRPRVSPNSAVLPSATRHWRGRSTPGAVPRVEKTSHPLSNPDSPAFGAGAEPRPALEMVEDGRDVHRVARSSAIRASSDTVTPVRSTTMRAQLETTTNDAPHQN